MLMQTRSPIRRSRLTGLAFSALLLLASLAAGCGAIASPTPTPTAPSASPTPTGFHALVVVNVVKGAGTVVQQTQVMAIDPTTGQRLWARAVTGTPGAFPPARAGDSVVASFGIQASPYPASQIAAFDIHTGAILWSRAFSPNTQAFTGSTGSSIIIVTSAVSREAPGASQGLLVSALNPSDGTPIWQQAEPNQELYGPIRAAGGAVYLVSGQPAGAETAYILTVLNATTGVRIWQKALGTGTIVGTLADDSTYYVGLYPAHLAADVRTGRAGMLALPLLSPFAASTLTAYRATDGAQVWQANGFAAPQAAVGDHLYTTSATLDSGGRLTFSVMALNTVTGSRLWQSSELGIGDPTSRPFAAADAHGVYIFAMPEQTPSVHALMAATGAAQWTALANATVQAGVAGLGSVFAATVPATPAGQPPQPANVTITALNAATGTVRWTLVVQQSQAAMLVA